MPLSEGQRKIAAAFPEVTWALFDRLCIFRPEGVFSNLMAARLIAWLGEIEADTEHPFSRFLDLTRLRTIELSRLDVQNVAYWRQSTYKGPRVQSAILAQSPESCELAYAYSSFMSGSQIEVLVFENIKDAATWLGVTAESLGPAKANG